MKNHEVSNALTHTVLFKFKKHRQQWHTVRRRVYFTNFELRFSIEADEWSTSTIKICVCFLKKASIT